MTRYALRFRDGTIKVRRVDDDGEIATFKARSDREIYVLRFSPDGRYLATTHFPGLAVTVWNVDNGSVVLSDQSLIGGRAANFSPDSRRLALTQADGNILVYNLSDSRQISHLRMPYSGHVAFRPDGLRMAIVCGGPDKPSCKLVEVESGSVVTVITLPSNPNEAAWSPDGTRSQ